MVVGNKNTVRFQNNKRKKRRIIDKDERKKKKKKKVFQFDGQHTPFVCGELRTFAFFKVFVQLKHKLSHETLA